MKDKEKTKKQLPNELTTLRRRVAQLGKAKAERKRTTASRDELEKEITERKNAEEAIRQSERNYRFLIENLKDLIFTIDLGGKLTFISQSSEEILGYKSEEGINKNVIDFVPGEDRQRVIETIQRGMKGEKIVQFQTQAIKKSGDRVILEVTVSRIFKEEIAVGALAIARDITERNRAQEELRKHRDHLEDLVKERAEELVRTNQQLQQDITERKRAEEALRESEEIFRRFMEYSPIYVFFKDENIRALRLSKNFETMLGKPVEEMLGKNMDDLFPPELAKSMVADDMRIIKEGKEITVEEELNGRFYSTIKFPIFIEGKPPYLAGYTTDITERKKAEERRKLMTQVLELLNRSEPNIDQIRSLLLLVKQSTGIEAAGIRLKQGEDYPYYETYGFPEEFVEKENYLCARDQAGELIRDSAGEPYLECMCGNIISRRTDPSLPFFTKGGSFWTNSTTQLLVSTSEKDRQTRSRNRCNSAGYESVALIPLRSGSENAGLLQLNDKRKNMFSLEMIEFFEGVCASIGIALNRKEAQDALRRSEEKYRALFESAPGSILIFDLAGKVLDANEYSKMPRELNVGKHFLELGTIHPDDREFVKQQFGRLMAGEEEGTVELRIFPDTPNQRWVEVHAALLKKEGKPYAVQTISVDITERKRAEEELRKSKNYFRSLIENSFDTVMILDQQGAIQYVSASVERLLGYQRDDPLLETAFDFVHPEDQKYVMEKFAGCVQNPGLAITINLRLRHKDGSYRAVEATGRSLFHDPAVNGFIVNFRDITERKQMEDAIKKASEEWRKTFDTIPDIIMIVDPDYKILRVNQAMTKLFGLSYQEILGKKCYQLIHQTDSPPEFCPHWQTLRDGKEHSAEIYAPNLKRYFTVTSTPIFEETGKMTGAVHVMHDITIRKRTEGELVRAEKLESLSLLAGGIAHDFNNLLAVILGNLSLSLSGPALGPDLKESLQEAETASSRAKDLIQQLLTFAKGGAPIRKAANIIDLIKESTYFALSGSKVRAEFFIPGDLWPVEVDQPQISQVVNNLAINAVQAMPKGGTVKIIAENVLVEEKNDLPLKPGRYIKVSVMDQGIGISEENLSKIFDPYFTTKKTGSGLGLATAYSIIKKHDGLISVESKKNAGTNFFFYLPASTGSADPALFPEEPLTFGSGKILVMDDEEIVRNTARRMLKSIGYEVGLAEDGEKMILLYQKAKKSGRPFDAVIMDLTVAGGMGGKEAIKKLLKIDPNAIAIVSSGYSNDPIMAKYKRYGFAGFVAKPYQLAELSKALHQVLARRKSRRKSRQGQKLT